MNHQFHHIGVACSDIEKETQYFQHLGYEIEGEDFSDPVQGVNGRFLIGAGPRMELLSPIGENGVLSPWMKSGVKMYHTAYETSDLESSLEYFRSKRGKVVVKPVPAVAFGGRLISFLMLPNMLLIELIESTKE